MPDTRDETESPYRLEVVAAAISRDGRYLLGRRPPGDDRSGLWEFPGGKVDPGETREGALKRELLEELAIEVEVAGCVARIEHDYPDRRVAISLFRCRSVSGEPRPSFHSEVAWFTLADLETAELAGADRRLFRSL